MRGESEDSSCAVKEQPVGLLANPSPIGTAVASTLACAFALFAFKDTVRRMVATASFMMR